MLTSYKWGHIQADDHMFEAVFHDGIALLRVRNPVSGSYFIIDQVSRSVPKQVWRDIAKAQVTWLEEHGGT